jgi:type IV pilus assembly protein PilB
MGRHADWTSGQVRQQVGEHVLPYTTILPVNRRAGFTYPTALRSAMRHDPDVVLIGEMEDPETARIAQHISLTGHLVLVPLLADGAADAVRRMFEMEIEPHVLGMTLVGVVGQRLVRRICRACRESLDPSLVAADPTFLQLRELAAQGGYIPPDDATLYRGKGCDQCRNSGYKGRTGLFELIAIGEELRRMISRGLSREALESVAVEHGMPTLMAEGVRKAVEGETTIYEVLRVLAAPL